MKRQLCSAICALLSVQLLAVGSIGIVASSDTGSGTTELLYYSTGATFLGDSTNVAGKFTSIAAGDFDGDGIDEVVASRHVAAGFESDLYYYEFQSGSLYFDTTNRIGLFTSVATGNFDDDAQPEVAVATYTGTGVPGDLYNTEIFLYQPGSSGFYMDSTNDDGRYMSLTTGNLDADARDEIVVVKLHEDGLADQIESEFWIVDSDFTRANGDPRNLLAMDLTPNRYWDFTDAAVGNFDSGSQTANIIITSDRRHAVVPETSRAEFFTGDTDAATVAYSFDQVPKRSEGMVGVTTANLDGDEIDDVVIILNQDDSATYATVEIYHGNGISTSPTSVEYELKMNAQAVAVDSGDLDGDGLDEIVVLYDLLDGTSQIVTYDVDDSFQLSVLDIGAVFNGTGTDVVVLSAAIPGDTDLDGDVDGTDLASVGLNWSPGGSGMTWADGDFDADGDVDGSDLAQIGLNWNPAGATVPEPATLALLALGGLALIRRRG